MVFRNLTIVFKHLCLKMDPETIQKRVDAFPFWYHRIDLGDGVVTPGTCPFNVEIYKIPDSLHGKRVLDVGAWDGFWTFEALKRGAKEVVAVDDFSDYLGKLNKTDRRAWDTFDLAKEVLGYTDEQCKRYNMDVMNIDQALGGQHQGLGEFDVVFFFGTFYHLRHPFYVLEKLGKMCKEDIFIESAVCDDVAVYDSRGHGDKKILEFYPSHEYGNNQTNWFNPTLSCLAHMTVSCGFEEVSAWKVNNPQHVAMARGYVHGKK